MATLRIRFVNAGGVSSAIIRAAQLGFLYTHVDVAVPGGYLGAHARGGVAIRPAGYDGARAIERFFELDVTEAQAEHFNDFLRSQLGKPYDLSAIGDFALAAIGIRFRVAAPGDWRDHARWFCSELVVAALIDAGILVLPADLFDARHISPENAALVIGCLLFARVAPACGAVAA